MSLYYGGVIGDNIAVQDVIRRQSVNDSKYVWGLCTFVCGSYWFIVYYYDNELSFAKGMSWYNEGYKHKWADEQDIF